MYGRFIQDVFGGFISLFAFRLWGSDVENGILPVGNGILPVGNGILPVG